MENLLELLIKIEGGTASAQEIAQVQQALRGVGHEHSAIKERFQEGFQHVALKSFISDGASAIGIGGEIRPVIGLLNVGITELGESMGIAAGPIGLTIAGLAALGGLGALVYEHTKKEAEATGELSAKQSEAVKSTDELRDALKEELEEVGKLPAGLNSLLQATKDLDAAQREQLDHIKGQQLASLQSQLSSNRELQASTKVQIADLEALNGKYDPTIQAVRHYDEQIKTLKESLDELGRAEQKIGVDMAASKEDVKSIRKGFASAAEEAKHLAEAHKEAGQEAKKQHDKILAQLDEERASRAAVSKSIEAQKQEFQSESESVSRISQQAADKQAEADADLKKKRLASIDAWERANIQAAQSILQNTTLVGVQREQIETKVNSAVQQVHATATARRRAEDEKGSENISQLWEKTGANISGSFSHAAAQSILESKNMGDAMKQVSKQVAEQVISDLIQMMIHAIATTEAMQALKAATLAII